MSKSALVRSPRYLDTGMGACGPDEPVICRICGRPILKGEPRYREPEGDVHLDCRRLTRALSGPSGADGDWVTPRITNANTHEQHRDW
jgi:hypothetical protein